MVTGPIRGAVKEGCRVVICTAVTRRRFLERKRLASGLSGGCPHPARIDAIAARPVR
jgi:hypothetical protein